MQERETENGDKIDKLEKEVQERKNTKNHERAPRI